MTGRVRNAAPSTVPATPPVSAATANTPGGHAATRRGDPVGEVRRAGHVDAVQGELRRRPQHGQQHDGSRAAESRKQRGRRERRAEHHRCSAAEPGCGPVADRAEHRLREDGDRRRDRHDQREAADLARRVERRDLCRQQDGDDARVVGEQQQRHDREAAEQLRQRARSRDRRCPRTSSCHVPANILALRGEASAASPRHPGQAGNSARGPAPEPADQDAGKKEQERSGGERADRDWTRGAELGRNRSSLDVHGGLFRFERSQLLGRRLRERGVLDQARQHIRGRHDVRVRRDLGVLAREEGGPYGRQTGHHRVDDQDVLQRDVAGVRDEERVLDRLPASARPLPLPSISSPVFSIVSPGSRIGERCDRLRRGRRDPATTGR